MAIIRPKTPEPAACQQCILAKAVPDSPAYAVTREQLKAIADVRELARQAWLGAGTNTALRDLAEDVASRLRGL